MISHSIETEAKKAHKPGERDHHAVLCGCGLVSLAYGIKTYTYENLYSVGFLASYMKISINEKFPL